MQRRLAFWAAMIALALPGSAALAANLPRLVSMNVCTDQLVLTLADPEQILGLSRFARDGWQSKAGDISRYPHGATDPARLSPRDAEAVLRAMQAVDVMEFSDRRVTELSGGERSRVALARALAVEAPVILADEPTASLDPRHQIDVMKNLRATADKGVLVIVVTHDLGLAARFADHVLVLREGRLVSQGAPAEALSERVLADVFRISAYRAEFQSDAVIVPWADI